MRGSVETEQGKSLYSTQLLPQRPHTLRSFTSSFLDTDLNDLIC